MSRASTTKAIKASTLMILSPVECWATWISIAAPYSTVLGKASFIVRGCFIIVLGWLIVRVVVRVAGEDLPPPPFFIIFCVHSGLVSLRFWLILVCICTFATSSETGGYMWLCYRLQMPLRHELESESYKFQI